MPSLLNHKAISTQLTARELQSLRNLGHDDAADMIEAQAEEIRVIRANHAQLLKDFDARNELLEKEQQEHLLTKGTLMVREAELAAERKIYKAARPGTAMPRPEQRCEPEPLDWIGNA